MAAVLCVCARVCLSGKAQGGNLRAAECYAREILVNTMPNGAHRHRNATTPTAKLGLPALHVCTRRGASYNSYPHIPPVNSSFNDEVHFP
jgi:hypothetical protein